MICSRLRGLDSGMTLTWYDGFVFIIDFTKLIMRQHILEYVPLCRPFNHRKMLLFKIEDGAFQNAVEVESCVVRKTRLKQ